MTVIISTILGFTSATITNCFRNRAVFKIQFLSTFSSEELIIYIIIQFGYVGQTFLFFYYKNHP